MLHSIVLIVSRLLPLGLLVGGLALHCPASVPTPPYASTNIGNPAIKGSAVTTANGYTITAGGADIGGAADQFFFYYQSQAGDFDLQLQVAALSLSDAWAKVGLMARATAKAESPFAAILATPTQSGCLFESRAATNAIAAMSGNLPVNYPYTWLRLQRTNTSTFNGYASQDGKVWTLLGSVVTTNLPATVLVGYAACGHSATAATTAQLGDVQATVSTALGQTPKTTEPLGPCTRRTGLVISEIMYHPPTVSVVTNGITNHLSLEFIELYNSQPYFQDISGFSLSGDVSYTFATGTVMQAGSFLVLAKAPADVQSYYGLKQVLGYGVTQYVTNIVGGGTNITTNTVNSLSNTGGLIRLLSRAQAVLLEVNYSSLSPWPTAADGAGHSLVLARPSYGEGEVRAWAASDQIGGSPGAPDPIGPEPARGVVINEFLANSEPPLLDFVELYNRGTTAVDVSGCYLSDSPSINKYRIADGTVLPAGGFISFDESQLGFALNASGERLLLVNSNQTRVLDALVYEAQSSGVSFGRCPDGAATWRALATRTPGTANGPYQQSDIVINEIMYGPISGDLNDQYVELYNKGSNAVSLGNWKFTAGIKFTFPTNCVLAANGYLVVARNAAQLQANYPNLNAGNLVGDFSGSLSHNGERLALARHELQATTNSLGHLVTNMIYVVVNEVTYGTSEKWGVWANAGGSSLELMDPHSDNRQSDNWADSDETAKSQWASFALTGTIGETLGSPVNDNLEIFLLEVGECLIDNVEVHSGTNQNSLGSAGAFESGMGGWVGQGSHDWSVIENQGYNSSKSLRLRAASRGDNGANRLRSPALIPAPTSAVSFKANARWLRGFPEVLLRLHGGGLEMPCRLPVPKNLGTPGARNSRAVTNTGPALSEVAHRPILPGAGQAVVVTARAADPDGLSSLTLKYRVDNTITAPSPASFTGVPMKDDGTGGDALAGDGIYSATIPAQAAAIMVAFYVEAVDSAAPRMTNVYPRNALAAAFPNDAPTHECVIRFGEVQMPGSFPTYHLWVTMITSNRWYNRDHLNNSLLDGTFVYNDSRVIYNEMPNYGGSPWHRGQMTSGPAGANRVDFAPVFPDDEPFLGVTDATWCNPGNPSGTTFSDLSMQSEQSSYIIFREIGVAANYRRYMHLFINGSQRSTSSDRPGNLLFEDGQQPNGDMVREWYSADSGGELYKIEDWFEFGDNGYDFSSNNDADLTRRTTLINGVTNFNAANIRFMFRHRSFAPWQSPSDYTNLFALVDALSPATNQDISPIQAVAQVEGLANIEQWMRIFACQHTVGNWDSYGFSRGKNDYTYKGLNGRFEQMTWDIDFTMGLGGNGTSDAIFQASDPRISAMWATPAFVRYYYRAFQDIVDGPLNNAFLDPILDAKAAAMAANNINYDPNQLQTIKSYTGARNSYLRSQLTPAAANFTRAGSSVINATSNLVTFTGTAPYTVQTIRVNGMAYPITWSGTQTAPTIWQMSVPIPVGTNQLVFQAFDRYGNLLATLPSFTNSVRYAGPAPDARGAVVLNEIMFNPLVSGAEYIEFFNTSSNYTFDLSGWVVNGLGYTFAAGSFIQPRTYLVLAKDRFAFAAAYGGSVRVFDQFSGNLQADGETLTLIKPGVTPDQDIVVDKVRYEAVLPWDPDAAGTGSSLQLIDPLQDNSRPGNWVSLFVPPRYSDAVYIPGLTNSGWRQVVVVTNFAASTRINMLLGYTTNVVDGVTNRTTNSVIVQRLMMYLDGPGDLYLDNLYVVTGTNAEQGLNYVHNGDFENSLVDDPLLTNSWIIATNYANTAISTDVKYAGQSSLHIVSTGPGTATNRILMQHVYPPILTNTPCTFSYWYQVANTNQATVWATNLTVRFQNGLNTVTNITPFVTPPIYYPPQLLARATNYFSPGLQNPMTTNLPSIPPLWLNEAQPENLTGIQDAAGHRVGWIELYNAGTNVESLAGLYLANTYSNLTQWAFPAGATIGPGQFKLIFADAVQSESSLAELHTSFTLALTNGSVALARLYNGQPQVLDYLNYAGVEADWSYGSLPTGQPFDRQVFTHSTPGTSNAAPPATVRINEWVASNINPGGFPDPVDGHYDDWFELYNPTSLNADISGYYLTDTLSNPTQWQVPNGTILRPYGYLLVWADNQVTQNGQGSYGDLHAPFQLSRSGEAIGLFARFGTNLVQIDAVTFGYQADNVSEGRYPDGSSNIISMVISTPRAPNQIPVPQNEPPVLGPLADQQVALGQTLSFTVMATDPDAGQTLTFGLDPGAPVGSGLDPVSGLFAWTPLPAQAPGSYPVTVRVTDNGTPPQSVTETFVVTVLVPPTITAQPAAQTVPEGASASFSVTATGSAPLSYQWQKNGRPLAGATATILTLQSVRTNDAGAYTVVVSNTAGTVTSSAAALRVQYQRDYGFANADLIQIPDLSLALPYPSVLAVRHVDGTLVTVTVTLSNLTHKWPGDLDLLLVSPQGQAVLFMSDAGTGATFGQTLTFNDSAANRLPQFGALVSGIYRPTAYSTNEVLPVPAPTGPYSQVLAAFNGTLPNGTWSLFARDDVYKDGGWITNGWSLVLRTENVTTDGTSASLVLGVPVPLGAGQFQVTIMGEPGHVLDVLASQDMARWTTNATLTNTIGSVIFTNSATGAPAQFYRARQR